MATQPPEASPLLAQVPVTELAPHLSTGGHDDSAPRTEVRRRVGLSRAAKRSASLLFVGLGATSMLALRRGAAAAVSDGLGSEDAVLLAMLGLITLAVASQALSLLRALPGTRGIWRWAARARQGRAAPTPGRPLLAQADARTLQPHMPASTRRDGGDRLRPAAATAGWVAMTLVIMAAAIAGTGLVALSAIRSVNALGLGFSTLLGLSVAALIGYGGTTMSIGLIRSWFEHRRRRLRHMLIRLLRYLLRGFDRSTTALQRIPVGFEGATGLLGGSALATGGAAVVVVASLAIPALGVEGTVANADDSTSTSTSTSIVIAVGGDHRTAAGIATAGSQTEEGGVKATTTTKTTTTAKTTTTTTTTTAAPGDTTGPAVSGISDGPDPIFTAGNTPDTSQITVTTSDKSGVATVTVYYRLGGGSFAVWASLKPGTASTTFGPFTKAGTYEYRIMATDTLGNANCKTPETCPGGTVTVTSP